VRPATVLSWKQKLRADLAWNAGARSPVIFKWQVYRRDHFAASAAQLFFRVGVLRGFLKRILNDAALFLSAE